MDCPRCAALVPTTEITEGLAHCAACDHVWEAPQARPSESVDFDTVWEPPGVAKKRCSADQVVIDLPWRHDNKLYHALWLFVVLPLLTGGGLQAVLVSGLAFVAWLALHFNVTTVTVTRDGVAVEHTFPLPGALPVTLRPDELAGLQVQTQQEVQGRWSPRLESFFTLATAEATLLKTWDTEQKMTYVRDAIVHVHGADAVRPESELTVDPPPFGVMARPQPDDADGWDARDGVELELPWGAHGGVGIHVFAAVGLLFLNSGIFAFPFAALSLACWFYLLRNGTFIRLDSAGMTLANGPLPTPWESDVRLTPAQVGRLRVEEREVWTGRYHMVYFDLMLDHKTLLRGWRDPNKLEYVVASAQKVVGFGSSGPNERSTEVGEPGQPGRERSVHERVHGRRA